VPWPTWTEATQVIAAAASLLWPVAIIFLVVVFRKDVRALVSGRKLKRGKLFGQEFELEEQLNKLEEQTKTFTQIDAAPLPEPSPLPETPAPSAQQQVLDVVRQVLTEAGTSPKAALMSLAAEMEAALRTMLGRAGVPVGSKTTFRDSLSFLQQQGMPKDLVDAMIAFRNVRNRIVHGYAAQDDDVLRAIDIGLRILNQLRALPHPTKHQHTQGH
jgi:hypothetical protein